MERFHSSGAPLTKNLPPIPTIVADHEWLALLQERPPWELQVIVVDTIGVKADALLGLLDEEERARSANYRFAIDRDRFVISHAVFRIVLGRALNVAPQSLVFATAPRWAHPPRLAEKRKLFPSLSLSRSGQYAAIAIGRGDPVGVDIEWRRPFDDWNSVAHTALAPSERLQLLTLPQVDRGEAVLRYWTGKEAVLKALGRGLSISPEKAVLHFSLSGWPVSATVTLDGKLVDLDVSLLDPVGAIPVIVSIASTRYQSLRLTCTNAMTLLASEREDSITSRWNR
jgi:phosphopantetheinyl transferase